MLKFIHTADIHIDSAFTARFTVSQARGLRADILKSFSRIIDLAKNADILLIAGDLFETRRPSGAAVSYVKRKFAEIPNTKVFIAAGNHDPYTEDSVYANENLGENVHVFSTEAECVSLPELNARVFGISFSRPHFDYTLPLPDIIKIDGIFDIMVMHADLVSAGGKSNYNPVCENTIAECGADYLALGHVHDRSEIKLCGQTRFAYSGIPQGRGFDELGECGCYLLTWDGEYIKAEFVKTCVRKMLEISVDVSGAQDAMHISEMVRAAVEKAGNKEDYFKILLKGRVEPCISDPDLLADELKEVSSYADITDKTLPCYDIDALAKQDSLTGEFVRIMLKKMQKSTDIHYKEAMYEGLRVLTGGDEA